MARQREVLRLMTVGDIIDRPGPRRTRQRPAFDAADRHRQRKVTLRAALSFTLRAALSFTLRAALSFTLPAALSCTVTA